MKKLNITKEQFNRSNYFQKKYGKLEYVSESGNLYKTNKGKVLKFVKESNDYDFENDPTWKAMTEPIGELYKMLVLDANEHDPEGEALKKAGKKIQEALTEYFNETRGQSFPLNESKLFGKKFNESTSGEPVFLNVERFREEVTEVLQEEADSWDDETGSMKYNAEEYLG